MKLHVCMLDKDCRRWDKPKRIYLFTKHHEFGLAYAKGDKFITSKADDLPVIRTAWWYHEGKFVNPIKYAIVWSLVQICSVLDHLPYYDIKHREFNKNCLGCVIGFSGWSAQLDDHWETEVWKPII